MKFSETPPPLRKPQIDIVNHRWRQLYDLEKEHGQGALQYLFLTNAGGAAATLAFIGAVGADKIRVGAKWSLAFYVLGVIFLGFSRAKNFHHVSGLFKRFKHMAGEYFDDKRTYPDLIKEDTAKAVDDLWDYIIPYMSFGCFIIGSIVGFCALI